MKTYFLLYSYRKFHVVLIFLMSVCALGACHSAHNNRIEKTQNMEVQIQAPFDLPPYRIQVGDILEVKFLYNEEFNQEIVVRPDGVITTAAVQSIKAAGRMPEDVAKDLTQAYKAHLKDPKLSVLVKSFAPVRIYVLGEVKLPGEYISVEPNPTLLQILAKAGGLQNSAEASQILIIRRDESGAPKFYLSNYDDIVNGLNPAADVKLASYDVVFVPRTVIADAYAAYEQYVKQFVPSSFGFGYNLNPDND